MGEDATGGGIPVGEPGSIPRDDAFSALAHPVRRQLLVALLESDAPKGLSELSRSLNTESTRGTGEGSHEIRISLYHNHVPKLDEAGIVSYFEEREAVELTEDGQALATVLAQQSNR